MKVLIDSHSTVTQNESGGLQVRIKQHVKYLSKVGVEAKLFDKWNDKISEYDIFHLFKVTKESFNEILYAKQKGKKVVVSAVIPLNNSSGINISLKLGALLKLNLPQTFIQKTLQYADAVTTQTGQEKQFIVDNYKIDSNKIIVIPNGVSDFFLEEDEPTVSFSSHYKISKPFVLQVGRIDYNKNQLNVIRALKGLDMPVVFVGGAFLNEISYFEQCKRELSSNMLMTGWIENGSDLMRSAFREAKLLILPSHFETFGNVILEAGVSGANIVCSETLPINSYSTSKFWSTFNPDNLHSIKNAVLKEYHKSNSLEMKNHFIKNFSWDQIIMKYVELYKGLINKV